MIIWKEMIELNSLSIGVLLFYPSNGTSNASPRSMELTTNIFSWIQTMPQIFHEGFFAMDEFILIIDESMNSENLKLMISY